MRRFCAMIILLILSARAAFAAPAMEELVIYDNDWSVTNGGYVAETSLMPLLTTDRYRLAALTAVSGDFWRDEGTTSLLRFLELVDARAVPVARGAVFPLVNTAERHRIWEQRFGAIPWSGAWNSTAVQKDAHRDDPLQIIAPKEGMPRLKASLLEASAVLIATVRAHPHQVTIYAEGPLTNIALAVRRDPDFASLAKRIVIQGSNATGDHDDGSQPVEFNVLFDPEAADIVLRAPWAQVLLIGDASNHTLMTAALLRRIQAIDTPAARYALSNAGMGMPLWSELGAAILVDPTIVTASREAIVQVDISHGKDYGRTRTWPVGSRDVPEQGLGKVRIVTGIDTEKFLQTYLTALAARVRPLYARKRPARGLMPGASNSTPIPPAALKAAMPK